MATRMSRWGVGPAFALSALAYLGVAVGVWWWYGNPLRITVDHYGLMVGVGVGLIVLGTLCYGVAAVRVMRAYNAGRLCTAGPYAACRHPVYAAWVFLIGPGVALLTNSWIILTVPVVMLISARILVGAEDEYLADRFGRAYEDYRRRVPALLPIGWLRRGVPAPK